MWEHQIRTVSNSNLYFRGHPYFPKEAGSFADTFIAIMKFVKSSSPWKSTENLKYFFYKFVIDTIILSAVYCK